MSDVAPQSDLARQAVDYLGRILRQPDLPPPPLELSEIDGFDGLCEHLDKIKIALREFSLGDFEHKLKQSGAMAGYVKGVQGNLRHLAWQCGTIASGDLRHRVDFMGDLSDAFNRMAESLINQEEMIRWKQTQLEELANSLKGEIAKKETVEAALRENEEMYRQQSLRDPLTWLYNRGYFFEAAAREIKKLKRQESGSACILMMDIDHFKTFNDTHGHLAGDQALKMVAEGINSILRKSDIFARYGGEEFILMLADSSLHDGRTIADRIRKNVARQPIQVESGLVSITLSLGLAHISNDQLDPQAPDLDLLIQAIARADAALYSAKHQGRDMVVIADEPANGSQIAEKGD